MGSKIKTGSISSSRSKLSHFLGLQIIICVALCLFFLLLFLKLSEGVFLKEVLIFDENVMNYIYSFRTPTLNNLMLNITFFGSSLFLFFASALTALYIYTKRKQDLFIFLAIVYSAVVINLILKYLFARPRPDLMPLIHENSYSYPSAHAMNSFIFYSMIAYFILRTTKNVRVGILISSIFAFLIFIIGLSRVYLGAHYPSDVIAGWIGGLVWITAAIIFEKTIIFKRLYKTKNNTK